MTLLTQIARRVRFGRPIIIVSGLPRSGTSMMMKMLGAGGLPLLTDGVRTPDDSNPDGYFELEAVKSLDTRVDRSWLDGARGQGVKILSPLLAYLPDTYNYRVIFMQRPLQEVLASQNIMLARAGEATDVVPASEVIAQYDAHLRRVRALLASRPCVETLFVEHGEVLADPRAQADRVNAFVGGGLDPARMAEAVNARLYRNRSADSVRRA